MTARELFCCHIWTPPARKSEKRLRETVAVIYPACVMGGIECGPGPDGNPRA
jgi:hypothetical protein